MTHVFSSDLRPFVERHWSGRGNVHSVLEDAVHAGEALLGEAGLGPGHPELGERAEPQGDVGPTQARVGVLQPAKRGSGTPWTPNPWIANKAPRGCGSSGKRGRGGFAIEVT